MSSEELDQKLGEAVYELVEEQAFVPPLYVAVVAANGEAMILHYQVSDTLDALEASIVAEHLPEQLMHLPVNLLFVDSHGRAAHMVIEADEARWIH